jgi:hypothetical protein
MLENLVFFNWYGNGDLFNSREFVKELMERIPAENYMYRHPKHPNVFQDIPELGHDKINEHCLNGKGFNKVGNNLYINTWIGRDSSYVLPGLGCTIKMNVKMYNDILRSAGIDVQLERPLVDYIPEVNFSKLPRMRKVQGFADIALRYQSTVLWVTSTAQSAQADNFSFWPAIEIITDEFPDYCFVVTDEIPQELYENRGNIYYTGDIIGTDDGFDLNDISNLSTMMEIIIGRPTGPFTFSQVKDNMMSETTALLGFSYHPNVLCFAQSFETPIKKYWTGDTETEKVIKHVRSVITR